MIAYAIVFDGGSIGISLLLIAGIIACYVCYNAGVDVGRDRGRLEAYEEEEEEEEGGAK